MQVLFLAVYVSRAFYFRTEAATYEIYENNMHTKYSGFTVYKKSRYKDFDTGIPTHKFRGNLFCSSQTDVGRSVLLDHWAEKRHDFRKLLRLSIAHVVGDMAFWMQMTIKLTTEVEDGADFK